MASIYTDATGVKQMLRFYQSCLNYRDLTVQIDLSNIIWIDGNMCTFLGALLYRLGQANNLSFRMDEQQVASSCEILLHNDFLQVDQDLRAFKKKSSIPSPKDVTGCMASCPQV